MQRSASHDPAPLSPNEKITGGVVLLTLFVSTWAWAGIASWAPAVCTPLAGFAALAAVLLSRREGAGFAFKAFLPAILFLLMVLISLCNPAYTRLSASAEVWVPRQAWQPWLPGTVDRETTLTAALPWFSALLLGAALRQAAFGRRAMRLLWGALLIHGLLVAAVGAFFHFTNHDMILGLYRDRLGYHFGPFIYRNHWAAYVIIQVALALGFSSSALRRWLVARGRLDAVLPGLIAALLLALTLPMPGSRSGVVVVSILLGTAFLRMGWLLWSAPQWHWTKTMRWFTLLGLAVFWGATVTVGGWLNREAIRRQWLRTVPEIRGLVAGQGNLRVQFARDAVRMAWDRPVWGWGTGSFGLVFPKYQGDYLRDKEGRITARVLHAHNDWTEIWAEMGLAGLAILLTPTVICLRDIFRQRANLPQWGGIGVVLILGYAAMDFPLHNPAVLLLWVTVLCTAAPQAGQEQ